MKCYSTGKGTISLWALLGIWSVSALTSLPGLAISPISDRLEVIFTGATELDIELLTTLPSLLIIPFIMLAGYISERIGYIKLLYIGLSLFLLSGALYFLCVTINELIVVSALLGVGAGIIIFSDVVLKFLYECLSFLRIGGVAILHALGKFSEDDH